MSSTVLRTRGRIPRRDVQYGECFRYLEKPPHGSSAWDPDPVHNGFVIQSDNEVQALPANWYVSHSRSYDYIVELVPRWDSVKSQEPGNRFPHTCPRPGCGCPAYIGFREVECSSLDCGMR